MLLLQHDNNQYVRKWVGNRLSSRKMPYVQFSLKQLKFNIEVLAYSYRIIKGRRQVWKNNFSKVHANSLYNSFFF